MRQPVQFVFRACLIAALTGCVDVGKAVGTDLHTPDGGKIARLQDAYVVSICRQAGLHAVAAEGSHSCEGPGGGWDSFVQAGMNDIDSRCDDYLAWLDNKRRAAKPILMELSKLGDATAAIMRISGASADAITIAGLAFGLAPNAFTNLNSIALIKSVDHSTVQAVVLGRQQRYRAGVHGKRIPNKLGAIDVLRNYLRLCMPTTIATELNITSATVTQGRPDSGIIVPGRIH